MILHYIYAPKQTHKHTAENKDYKIMLRDNSLFFPQTSGSRETQNGGN